MPVFVPEYTFIRMTDPAEHWSSGEIVSFDRSGRPGDPPVPETRTRHDIPARAVAGGLCTLVQSPGREEILAALTCDPR